MVKKAIRKIFNEKRDALDPSSIPDLEQQIVSNFESLALQGIQQLLSYCAIIGRCEFNVTVCEQLLKLENPALEIHLPKLMNDGVTMEAVKITEETSFWLNKYHIREPLSDNYTAPQLIDAVFVPLLAFDTRGFRVGYGKGFYDRYLARCAQDVVKIGFSWFEAIDVIDDIDEFDVPLNYCITPMRVYEF